MSEYMPTTDEVAESYVHDRFFLMDTVRSQEEAQDAFDRWLAQVRREAKVEALRETVGDLNDLDSNGDAVFWDGGGYELVTYWLNTRADQLEQEGKSDE